MRRGTVKFSIFHFPFSIREERGQSLVEVLIALMIVALVLTTVLVAVLLAIGSSRFSQHKARGSFLAQEAMEWIRSQRSALGWKGFLAHASGPGVTYCLKNLTQPPFTDPGACTAGEEIEGEYTREATLTLGAPDLDLKVRSIDIEVMVKWQEGAKTFASEVEGKLTQWDLAN